MAFVRPTLSELVDRIQTDFVSRLSLVGAVLRRSMVYVMARVFAGAAHMMHGHLDFLSLQMFPDSAEEEFLIRHASIYGLSKTEATYATGTVTFTGTNGSVIPEGAIMVRSDGAEYTADADATIASGEAEVSVTASEAGSDSTLDAGVALTLQSPIAGVDSTCTVDASTEDGNDEESTEDLRTRLLDRIQNPPHGGNKSDYVAWAKEVSGVTRAWCYPLELGAGTVTVRFVRDDDADPIPSAGEVEAVQDYIDAMRLVTANVTVVAPVATPLNFTLEITPDTVATRAAVEAEIEDFITRTCEPGSTTLLSQIEVTIGNSDGVTDFTITSPAADVTRTTGQLTTMGTITWV